MTTAAQVATNLTAAGFILLAVATVYEWYRRRSRAQAMLAYALGSLALVAGLGRLQSLIGQSTLLSVVSIVGFLASGYFVLLFRDTFVPLSQSMRRAALGLLLVASVFGVALVTVLAGAKPPLSTIVVLVIVLAWAIFVGEPIARFWLASRTLPVVQRARMRALSVGFAGLIAILVFDVAGGAAVQSPAAIVATQLIALAMVPIIYISFAPPAILRRIWRMSEEDRLRAAIQDLLIFSPNPQALAESAISWAMRLMGAQGAFIVDFDHKVMAAVGVDSQAIRNAVDQHPQGSPAVIATEGGGTMMLAPLRLSRGTGLLGVVAGPFTPVFGTDEINLLTAYAGSVTAGLERTRVTERMAAVEAHKTQFLNLASHELRGPLTVIRGYTSMLESGLLGELNDRGRKAAPVLSAKVMEMNALIEQMIEAARLEDGALLIKPKEADLRNIAATSVAAVKSVLDETHTLVLSSPGRPVKVRVDSERVQTIITNLIDNAVKYSPEGGEVTCVVTQRNGVARVSIKDRGIGIAQSDMATLFTRFGRVSRPDTDHLPGTGLGLYLGRQLARLHGGDITVDSTPGVGSNFTLHLPLRDQPELPAPADVPAEVPSPGRVETASS
jgi:signal transduction histidine kinase